MASQEFRVSDVCETADRLYGDQHPESEIVIGKCSSMAADFGRRFVDPDYERGRGGGGF